MKFTKLILALVLALSVATTSFAFMDAIYDDSNTNQQGQAQGQIGINDNDNTNQQGQGQGQGQIGINENVNDNYNRSYNENDARSNQDQDQGQLQGQSQDATAVQGQGQAMGQAQGNVGIQEGNDVNVAVEGDDYDSYAFAAPAMNAEKGTSPLNAYSVFGGVGVSQTEDYVVCVEKIATVERLQKAGYIDATRAKVEALEAFEQMKHATRPKRLLCFGPKTTGRHLLNVFGILNWEDGYKAIEDMKQE